MTNTPLNQDVLDKAYDAARSHEPSYRARLITVEELAERITRAYLAAAQPVVDSVEELDALPIGSIVQDLLEGWSHRKDTPTTWLGFGDENGFLAHDILLPARVLYRPEVKP